MASDYTPFFSLSKFREHFYLFKFTNINLNLNKITHPSTINYSHKSKFFGHRLFYILLI